MKKLINISQLALLLNLTNKKTKKPLNYESIGKKFLNCQFY